MIKNLPANAEDMKLRFNPGLGRSPGGGHGNPLQYTCLENPMNRGTGGLHSSWDHKESDMAKMT